MSAWNQSKGKGKGSPQTGWVWIADTTQTKGDSKGKGKGKGGKGKETAELAKQLQALQQQVKELKGPAPSTPPQKANKKVITDDEVIDISAQEGDIICPECETPHYNHKLKRCRECKGPLTPPKGPAPVKGPRGVQDPTVTPYNVRLMTSLGFPKPTEEQVPSSAQASGTTVESMEEDTTMEDAPPTANQVREAEQRTLDAMKANSPNSPLVKLQMQIIADLPKEKEPKVTQAIYTGAELMKMLAKYKEYHTSRKLEIQTDVDLCNQAIAKAQENLKETLKKQEEFEEASNTKITWIQVTLAEMRANHPEHFGATSSTAVLVSADAQRQPDLALMENEMVQYIEKGPEHVKTFYNELHLKMMKMEKQLETLLANAADSAKEAAGTPVPEKNKE